MIFISTCSDIHCIQGLSLWRESASVVNDELFKGYRQRDGGSGEGKTNEFVAGNLSFWSDFRKKSFNIGSFSLCITYFSPGYDFKNTNRNGLEINIWYNSTYNNNTAYVPISLLRVPRLVNTVCFYYSKTSFSSDTYVFQQLLIILMLSVQ